MAFLADKVLIGAVVIAAAVAIYMARNAAAQSAVELPPPAFDPPVAANYGAIGSGTTGHAESVQITYDPKVVSYGKLLQI